MTTNQFDFRKDKLTALIILPEKCIRKIIHTNALIEI